MPTKNMLYIKGQFGIFKRKRTEKNNYLAKQKEMKWQQQQTVKNFLSKVKSVLGET